MPFRHPDRSADLGTRIEFEVRERLEEAIDFICLEALVQQRRARGRPAPQADNAHDRGEFGDDVRAFLELLGAELTAGLTEEQRRRLRPAAEAPDDTARLLSLQVALARTLPDYWQRFEALSARYLAEPVGSGGDGRGLLARLLRRG